MGQLNGTAIRGQLYRAVMRGQLDVAFIRWQHTGLQYGKLYRGNYTGADIRKNIYGKLYGQLYKGSFTEVSITRKLYGPAIRGNYNYRGSFTWIAIWGQPYRYSYTRAAIRWQLNRGGKTGQLYRAAIRGRYTGKQ